MHRRGLQAGLWPWMSFFGVMALGSVTQQWGLAQDQPPLPLPPPPATIQATDGVSPDLAPQAAAIVRGQSIVSMPERIARLQRTIEADGARLVELKCLVDDPQSDYAKAERAFRELDTQLAEMKKAVEQAATGGDLAAAERAHSEQAEVERKWSLARDRFQLVIDERKAQLASITTLEEKIAKDESALGKLRGDGPPRPPVESTSSGVADPPAAPGVPVPSAPAREQATPALPTLLAPGLNMGTTANAAQQSAKSAAPASQNDESPTSVAKASSGKDTPRTKTKERLDAATKAAAESQQEATRAEDEAIEVTERLDVVRRDIALQRQLRQVADEKVDAARQQLVTLNAELDQKVAAREETAQVRAQIRDAESRMIAAQEESREIAERLDTRQTELSSLQADQLAALRQADEARLEAQLAENVVATLKNPLAWGNIRTWLVEHGVAILLILGIVTIILWAGQLLEQRVIRLIAGKSPRGGRNERENRARTLVSVMHNGVRIVAVGVGAIMVLDQLGLPVGPLMGGAAVLGLAVAFGAQSLIKDYFTGFMVLLEQQYMIDDVVKVGEVAGQVERITLRMTVLRDIEGRVHFIPHGQINTVTNLTHGWSRALFDIGVAYKENVDRVIEVLMGLANELKSDATFGLMILEDPVMMGVEALGDSAVVVRFAIKTRPLRQWEIKRELLRRIKNRFDELGIEIPFPHRMLYVGNAAELAGTQRGSTDANASRR